MRLFLTHSLLAIALIQTACDSSSGSKSSPVAQTPAIPVVQPTVPSGGGDAIVSNETGTTTATTGSTTETTVTGTSTDLKFGLTTTRQDLLKRLGDDLSLKAKDFRVAAEGLEAASAAYCSAPTPESLLAAQESWKKVMNVWQYFEVFQIGPVSENAKVLKTNIYAWPDVAAYCKIEEEALKSSKSATYKLPPNYNRKGLQAVEYMLFDNQGQSRCATGAAVGTEWNGLTAEAKTSTRCSYLKALTAEISVQGKNLESRWGVPGDNYLTKILGDSVKVNQAIQVLYEAAFYVDLEIKNQKLAGPAGIDTRYCTTVPTPCPEKAEFYLSGFSRQAVNTNIAAFVDMIFGASSSGRAGGLSALVRAEGVNGSGNEVATRTETIAANLSTATAVESESSLDQMITKFAQENCDVSSTTWICQTRNGIRQLFTDFKGEYAAILKVSAPAAAAGDND